MKAKTKTQNSKRYVSVSYRGIKGIRKDSKCGSFNVEKRFRGKRYTATFKTIREAAEWKKHFHPSVLNFKPSVSGNENKAKLVEKIKELPHLNPAVTARKNGTDYGYLFGDVWELYYEKHIAFLELSSHLSITSKGKHFLKDFMKIPMVEVTAEVISQHLASQKEIAIKTGNRRRYNFKADLKTLSAVLTWYRENIDAMFVNPMLKRHYKEGMIRQLPVKNKKMRKHELLIFFEQLQKDGQIWRDFAEMQFYFSGRVQEPAGLQWESVDFVDGVVEIEKVAVWDNSKSIAYLKDRPKNGQKRSIPITAKLLEILKRRLDCQTPSTMQDQRTGKAVPCNFVFHLDGEPLKYADIQRRYNKALQNSGLAEKYSSTHILRHSMANLVREKMGLDQAQAVGGWKTRALVENVYTESPAHLTKGALDNIASLMDKEKEEEVKRCHALPQREANAL